MDMEALNCKLELQEAELTKYRNTSEYMQQELTALRKQIASQEHTIKKQQQELHDLKSKQSHTSESSSSFRSMGSESINDFCPEMLSPDETVELLSQLLKKVGRSSKMMRAMREDSGMRGLLFKMNQN